MAIEVVLWSKRSLPRDFERVKPGNAIITRFIKKHADQVFIEKEKTRFGYEIVAYYAPADIVEQAKLHAHKCLRANSLQSQKRRRGQLLAAAAKQTLDVFFSFDEHAVNQVIKEYRNVYGEKKAEYLRRAYSEWRTGQREVSQPLRERFLSFLPPLLPIEQKYHIIKAIYRSSLPITTLEFLLRSENDVGAVLAAVEQHLTKPTLNTLPSIVHEVAAWLSDQDSQLCLAMIDRLKQDEERLLSQDLASQIQMLSVFVSKVEMKTSATRVIDLPSLKLKIRIEK